MAERKGRRLLHRWYFLPTIPTSKNNDMTYDQNRTPLQQAAIGFYRWYLGEIDSDEITEHLQHWVAATFDISINRRDLQLTYERLRNSPRFEPVKEQILARWQTALESCNRKPSEELAQQFIDYLVADLEHNTLAINAISVGIARIGANQFGDSATITSPRRDHWSLHITLKGSAIYSGDRDFITQRGDVILISPTADCFCRRNPASAHWLYAFAAFHPKSDWTNWMQWPPVADGLFRARINSASQFHVARNLLSEIYKTLSDALPHSESLGLNLLEQLLIRTQRGLPAMPETKTDPRISLACKVIQDNLTHPLSVEEVAKRCHLSPSRLAHLFKQEMDQSLQQYRDRLRMKLARNLLMATKLTVKAIASQTGYSDVQQFSRQFQKVNGISPSQFRECYSETY